MKKIGNEEIEQDNKFLVLGIVFAMTVNANCIFSKRYVKEIDSIMFMYHNFESAGETKKAMISYTAQITRNLNTMPGCLEAVRKEGIIK
jgi:hypothetical protein